MRRFVNPGNTAFEVAVNSQIYVDKTGLLAYTNSVINTGHIILNGINYDKKTKEHSCKIERFERVLQKVEKSMKTTTKDLTKGTI